MRSDAPQVLVLGRTAAARMAAILLAHRGGVRVRVSADVGAEVQGPGHRAIEVVLREAGVPDAVVPAPPTQGSVPDLLISVGEQPPPGPRGVRRVDWQLADPRGHDIPVLRALREDVDTCVAALLEELDPPG